MVLSISNQVVCREIESEEFISESNLLLSQTLQSFCKEATSCSAIFALAAGQAIGLLAKNQSFKYFSLLCKTGSSKIPAYYASSVLGVIAEGISFPLATQLGKNEKLEIGNFGNNFHGILTLALCKTIGKKLPINNFVFQHAIQDCAMVSLDVTCEVFGIIEQRNSSGAERFLDAELASIRVEASMRLLAMSCSGFSGMQAKRELGFEFEMGVKIKGKGGNPWFGNSLFSPEIVTSNGWLVKINTERESSSGNFFMQAKDLMMMAEGNHQNGGERDLKERTGSSETDEIFLDLLPRTSQTRWREVRAENKKLAAILIETWNELCGNPVYLKGVYDRERLMDQYEIASKFYLRKTGLYSEEKTRLLIDYGIEIFFRRVSDAEYFHIEDRSIEEGIVESEDRGAKKTQRNTNKGKAHHKLQSELRREQPILKIKEEKRATLEDYENLKRDHPELARWVQVSLASWSGVLDRVKEKHPYKVQELTGNSQTAFDTFEMNARTCLRRLVPPVPVQTIYEEVLPLGFKFRHLHEQISAYPYRLKIGDYYSKDERFPRPIDLHRRYSFSQDNSASALGRFLSASHSMRNRAVKRESFMLFSTTNSMRHPLPLSEYHSRGLHSFSTRLTFVPHFLTLPTEHREAIDLFPEALKKRIRSSQRGSDPENAFYILAKAIMKSGKSLIELKELMHVDLDRVMEVLLEDSESRSLIGLDILIQVKSALDDLNASFDGGKFYRDLYPSIKDVFPDMGSDSPCIVMTEDQFEKAHFFNLGEKLLAYRLDSQRADERLTTELIAQSLNVSTGTVQRYQINVIHVVDDRVLMRIFDSLLKFSQRDREIAYLASRPGIAELIPIWIIGKEGGRRRLTYDKAKDFQRRRIGYLNAGPLREEVAGALLQRGIKGEKQFAEYLESQGADPTKAKKFIVVGDPFSDEDIEMLTGSLNLSYRKWRRHFDLSVDTYFLGVNEEGSVRYPTREDFEKLDQVKPSSVKLMKKKYPEVADWKSLRTEEKWHLYLLQLVIDKFRTTDAASKKTGMTIIKSNQRFESGVVSRNWSTEMIAQFANTCELTPHERTLLYLYFRQKSLERKI